MVQIFGPKKVQALEGTIMPGAGYHLTPYQGGEKCSTSRRVSRWFRVTSRLNVGSRIHFLLDNMDGSDGQIIEEAEDVCKALDLKVRIRQLYWVDRTVGRKFKADECGFSLGLATFPVSMKGRLDAKEWRPLIASTMIYRKIISRNPPKSIMVTIAALFGLLVGGLGIFSKLFGSNGADLPSFLYIVLVIAPFLANRTTQGRKNQRLQADLEAARIFGRQELLSTLRKIDGMGIPDVIQTENRGFSRHFSSKPSVAERIANVAAADWLR